MNKSSNFFQMAQATIALEDMIKSEYLKKTWRYWSSLTMAAKISTLSSLALRIYSLDAAINYNKSSSSDDFQKSLKQEKKGTGDLTCISHV